VPEEDEATLNPYGLIGYELVAVTTVAATGRLVAYLKRGTFPEDAEDELGLTAANAAKFTVTILAEN
jgi:hypothetical protein